MKKIVLTLIVALSVCFVITGCGNKEDNKLVGGWEIQLTDTEVNLDLDQYQLFNKAKKNYSDMELDAISYVAKKGESSMYLALGYTNGNKDNATYKLVVVDENAKITKVADFDYSKFVNTDISKNSQTVTDEWKVVSPGKLYTLDDTEAQTALNKANVADSTILFNPIAIVAKQVVSGTNYAVLAFGKGTSTDTSYSLYLITLYADLDGDASMPYLSYINLTELTK